MLAVQTHQADSLNDCGKIYTTRALPFEPFLSGIKWHYVHSQCCVTIAPFPATQEFRGKVNFKKQKKLVCSSSQQPMLLFWQGRSPGTGPTLDKMPETSGPRKLHLFPVPTTLPVRPSPAQGVGAWRKTTASPEVPGPGRTNFCLFTGQRT